MDTGSARKIIMLVDDDAVTLAAGKEMLKSVYRVYPIFSGELLLDLLEHIQPDLILLDIEMPGMTGYQIIARLKDNLKWRDIPVIFVTARADEDSELEGLSMGAADYITKPFSAPLLLKRIENQLLVVESRKNLENFNASLQEMVSEKIREIVSLQNSIIGVVTDLVEFRDGATGGHINRTETYMKLMVEKILEERIYQEETANWNVGHLVSSSQLHDIGKLGISDAILNKPGKLTEEEFEIMKKHVEIGVQAIRKIEDNLQEKMADSSFLHYARLIVGSHHEKWDGSGYPLGLRGKDIPLEGRLMAIADVYDALISARPYKRPIPTEEARQIIESGSGSHFDPLLVGVFSQVADQFADIARNAAYR